MRSTRRGMTLVEAAVAVAIGASVLGGLVTALVGATRGAQLATQGSDGMQSVLLALDALSDDLAALVYQRPGDLRVDPNARAISFLAVRSLDADLFAVRGEPVTYQLVPAGASGAPYRLVRIDDRGRRTIGGCLLADLKVRVTAGGRGRQSPRVEMTAVAWSPDPARPGFVGTQVRSFAVAERPR